MFSSYTNKHTFLILFLFAFIVSIFVSCLGSKNSDEKNAQTLLFGFASVTSANQAATKAAAQISSAIITIGRTISGAALQGNIAFHNLPTKDRKKLLAEIRTRIHRKMVAQHWRTPIYLTNLEKLNGFDTCDETGCNAILNGEDLCDSENFDPELGTFELFNFDVNSTFGGDYSTTGLFDYSSTMKGRIKLTKCFSRSKDYFNFPSVSSSITTGDIDYDGSQTVTESDFVENLDDPSRYSITEIFKETSTTRSSNMQINGGAAQSIVVTQAVDLTINSSIDESDQRQEENFVIFTTSYDDTVTGTVTVSGSVGGGNVNVSRTYNNDRFTYDSVCRINVQDGTGDCSITVK